MNILNELLNLSEAAKGTTLVGLTINKKLVTAETKNEVWHGDFSCRNNPVLTSLKGSPKEVTGGDFDCSINDNLTSLKGSPTKVTGNFWCGNNPKLVSLESNLDEVTGYFSCGDNPSLTSLKGIPKIVGTISCTNNPKITSLEGIHKQITRLKGRFIANKTPIKTHVLGLLLINGCTEVIFDNKEVAAILNKYLPNTRGNKAVIDCQYELSDAGFDDFAEL